MILFIHVKIAATLFFGLTHQLFRQLIDLHIDIHIAFSLTRDNQRCTRFVDQDGIHLVHDGIVQLALEALTHLHRGVDAHTHVGQHRLVEDQVREVEHGGDQHPCVATGAMPWCWSMTRRQWQPARRRAWHSLRVSPRTRRHSVAQPVSPSTTHSSVRKVKRGFQRPNEISLRVKRITEYFLY